MLSTSVSAMPAARPAEPDAQRRARLLDVALATFLRYGFRKTSMEEVARAAGLSRQGLYLHFPTKDDLFREVVRHALTAGLASVRASLGDAAATLEARLVSAFDAWTGRFVGMLGGDVIDLHDAITQYGSLIAEYEEHVVDAISRALRPHRRAGLTARQLAETLAATARGLKHDCRTRADFRDRIAIAVRALCAPAPD
jgi:TetR/AcrR family transcriptional regulator, regulator of autoinduction and epiphytic fitness